MSAPMHTTARWRTPRIGLTGGIGSGKSTVAAILATLGAEILDADAIARSVTAAGGAALPAITEQFGPDFTDTQGALDRSRMRDHVFEHPEAREQLEAIIHPLVGAITLAKADAAQEAGAPLIVHDIPLLAESPHWPARLDHILVVDCPREGQIERVQARNGWGLAQIEAILAAQASREQRCHLADSIIYNWAISLEALHLQVRTWARQFGL